MGDKAAAKRLMEKAGVPLVPGYHGEKQDAAFLEKEAARIGFPVLIKPSAGGGGKGMRVVDWKVFLCRSARGVEARGQILLRRRSRADRALPRAPAAHRGPGVRRYARQCACISSSATARCSAATRRCSRKRRPPAFPQTKRMEMGAAAVAAARAIGYSGAGTVEFIAEQDGRFYFMEMNTRLQVEHPVTEMITGLDLVEWQLRVAAGEPLPVQRRRSWCSGATPSRRASTPRTRRAISCPRPDASRTCAFPTKARACGSTPASAPAPRSRRGTTR